MGRLYKELPDGTARLENIPPLVVETESKSEKATHGMTHGIRYTRRPPKADMLGTMPGARND